jgi:3-deoxy-D-manno-octulosonic acid kinase
MEPGIWGRSDMHQPDIREMRNERGLIVYDATRLDQIGVETLDSSLFDPGYWRSLDRLQTAGQGRGGAFFVRSNGTEWVLRQYRRGGLAAKFSVDRYLWLGETRSRPVREFRLLVDMEALGLPAPPPVAAHVHCRRLTCSGGIITRKLPGQPFSRQLQHREVQAEVWPKIGECVRRFHNAGVWHADLNAHNILIDGKDIRLIDFDRGCFRRPGRWHRSNLDRLQRSVRKLLGPHWQDDSRWRELWLELERGYVNPPMRQL